MNSQPYYRAYGASLESIGDLDDPALDTDTIFITALEAAGWRVLGVDDADSSHAADIERAGA